MVSGHLAYMTAAEHQKDLLRAAERERRLSGQRRSRGADEGVASMAKTRAVRRLFPFHRGVAVVR